MDSPQCNPLHIIFFPFMSHNYMIPTIDMAKIFASKGVKATIVTTPLNKPFFSRSIEQFKIHFNNIDIQTIKFPCVEGGLPEGCENVDAIPTISLLPTFFTATKLLQQPFEELLLQQKPHCIVADMFFPWATDSATKFGIPRIVFHATGFFSLCVSQCLEQYEPFKNVSSETEEFFIPNLPGNIKMTRLQLPNIFTKNDAITQNIAKLYAEMRESEARSYGVIVNSFYELDGVYADYYREVLGKKEWHIGPFSVYNRDMDTSYCRKEPSINKHECLKWLDTKDINSIVYVCFGSKNHFLNSQLKEIAMGLEASGKDFVWVVKKNAEDREIKGLLEFEKRMKGKGLIIRGWSPQLLILQHKAIGAIVTHCGWNLTLESVAAGVPMITWPIAPEQFYNEKLVTDVLKIGVPVGAKTWDGKVSDKVHWDAVEKAVKKVMEGEEAKEMRNKAKVLAKMAKKAVEEGGSSYSQLNALIEELGSLCHHQHISKE
ncbi:putative hexosyltransferase [Medicago truncatula]|nr:scopoletin glucosyltransferase [Medicago truncatula]RHN62166.1 putative hexosyltransferase [Medicago truncatula]